jgi:NADH:ubiquinone oxidoreductase subunit 3 (subunit A)
MQPKTKLILYSVIGVLLLSMIIISFFINQSIQQPKADKGIYKEPEQLKSQPAGQATAASAGQATAVLDKYQCGNVTTETQGMCVAMGWMLDNMYIVAIATTGLMMIVAFIKPFRIFRF